MTSSPDAKPAEDQLRREAFELMSRSARLRAEAENLSVRAEELFLELAAISRSRNREAAESAAVHLTK